MKINSLHIEQRGPRSELLYVFTNHPCGLCHHFVIVVGLERFNDLWGYPILRFAYGTRLLIRRDHMTVQANQ